MKVLDFRVWGLGLKRLWTSNWLSRTLNEYSASYTIPYMVNATWKSCVGVEGVGLKV